VVAGRQRKLFSGGHQNFPTNTGPMTSQIYLQGHLLGNPESATTKRGKLWLKVLLETSLIRETRPGELQSETVTIPISFFARPAEQVKNLKAGDSLVVACRLCGTKFESDAGTKHGVVLVADKVFINQERKSST